MLLSRMPAAAAGSAVVLSPPEWELLRQLARWPRDKAFPVMDVLRCCVLSGEVAGRLAAEAQAPTSSSGALTAGSTDTRVGSWLFHSFPTF